MNEEIKSLVQDGDITKCGEQRVRILLPHL